MLNLEFMDLTITHSFILLGCGCQRSQGSISFFNEKNKHRLSRDWSFSNPKVSGLPEYLLGRFSITWLYPFISKVESKCGNTGRGAAFMEGKTWTSLYEAPSENMADGDMGKVAS